MADGSFSVPNDMMADWLTEDVRHLMNSSRSPQRKLFRRRRAYEDESLGLDIEQLEAADEDHLKVRLAIGSVAARLEGLYPLADTARFMNGVRTNAPDPYETMPLRRLEQAKALSRSVQTLKENRRSLSVDTS